MNDYRCKGVAPDMTEADFLRVLREGNSPVPVGAARAVYSYCLARRLSPAYLLAMFWMESKFGREGKAAQTCSWGNTTEPSFGVPGVGVIGRFTDYANWADGGVSTVARHFDHAPYKSLTTVREIIPVWAPKSENDTENYIRVVLAQIARYAPPDAPGTTKGTTMALPTREAIIPATNANRPKLPMVPKFITIHETANVNRGANAEMHRKFLVNGGGADGVSFHWCVDDREAVHLVPDNEVAWHAGDGANGPGNRTSIAIETCVNSDGDFPQTVRNLIELVALLMKRHGIPLANVVPHQHWSGKTCPATIIKTGQWTGLKAAISVASRATPAPPTGSVRHYLNPQGETIIEVNMGGKAVEILGVNLVDIGATVKNEAGEVYDRSIIGNEFREWVKR